MREGKGLEDDAVHHREDRGVGPDAQRDGDDRRQGERGGAPQRAQAVGQVLPELAHVVPPPPLLFDVAVHGAQVAARLVEVAELAQCPRAGLVRREPPGDERLGTGVEVEGQLRVHVAPDHGARPSPELEDAPHQAGSSTRKTAAAYRRQADSSVLSRARPAGVSR